MTASKLDATGLAKSLCAYLALVTLLSGAFILLMLSLGERGYWLAQVYMLTPALAAVLTRLFVYPLRFRDAYFRIGRLTAYGRFWLVGLAIIAVQALLFTLLGAIRWDLSGATFLGRLAEQMAAAGQDINQLPPGMTPQLMLWMYFIGGLTVFGIFPGILTGFGEEFGWRGLMFPLLYRMRPWVAFVIGGLLWFAWHVPLTLVFPASQPLTPAQSLANVIILAVGSVFTFAFLAYVYVKSASILVVSFVHAVIDNASRSLSYVVILDDPLKANLGLTIAGGIVMLALFWSGDLRIFREWFRHAES